MEFLILPVKEDAEKEFKNIYRGLRVNGMSEYASYLNRYVSVVDVDENNPYVEIKIPKINKND